ncbi:MAG: glycine--tRNA ligase [Patescibacteria group bacterium]
MNENTKDLSQVDLKTITDFCRRKGFVYPSSEIYGGYSAVFDFGPLGVLLKKNIEKAWRDHFVTHRVDSVEIEGAIFLHPKVWEASGHVGGFSDLLVEDEQTNKRYRADHLIEDAKVNLPPALNDGKEDTIIDNAGYLTPEQIDEVIQFHQLKSPEGNNLSKCKKFNLLVKTHLGPVEDSSTVAYLKGESCQNIYVDYKQVQETTRKKIPFGIAQLGKAFRNEITARQFLFRTRELEQADMQFFIKPDKFLSEGDKTEMEWYQYWKDYSWKFYEEVLPLNKTKLSWRQHDEDEKAFYASDAWDIQYDYSSMGPKEIGGLHHRGTYDLDQHSKFSGQDLSYFDQEKGQRYNPAVIETSLGLGRMFLAVVFDNYKVETVSEGDERIVFTLPKNLAPYRYAVLPLMKKDGLAEKAQELHINLKKRGVSVDYDEAGSIGKRYRRQDENGTPECICIDYQTLEDGTVTIRDRDTMEQKRISIDEL